MKFCKYCNNDIDRPAPKRSPIPIKQMGKQVYNAVMGRQMRTIDLCNFDYTLYQVYKQSLKPVKIYSEAEKLDIIQKLNITITPEEFMTQNGGSKA